MIDKQVRTSRTQPHRGFSSGIHSCTILRAFRFGIVQHMESSSGQGFPAFGTKISLPTSLQGSGSSTSQDAHELDAQRLCGRASPKHSQSTRFVYLTSGTFQLSDLTSADFGLSPQAQ